ncbi:hypothetical protein CR513_05490, partial [Mucuna pruriens]
MCDASNSALGDVLGQRAGIGQPMHVIAYASRTMEPQAKLTRVNGRVSAEMKSSWPNQLHLGQARVVSAVHALQPSSPIKERPNCAVHISYPPKCQLSYHVTLGESATSRWKIFAGVE